MKVLIVRISSFGDIVQALRVPAAIRSKHPQAEIDWLVREDFADVLQNHPQIHKLHTIKKSANYVELLASFRKIKSENYDAIYDAHRNLRSFLLRIYLIFQKHKWLSRPKNRLKRFLFFQFRCKVLPTPFVGQKSFLQPLKKWGIGNFIYPPQFNVRPEALEKVKSLIEEKKRTHKIIAAAPSANWEMKRWPIEHWQKLLELSKNERWHWVFLGGPSDSFIEDFLAQQSNREYTNFSGQLSLSESSALVSLSDHVIANDTGLMHVADQLEVKTLALIGPAAFGYPFSPSSKVLEVSLPCKPCSKDGRGKCSQDVYKLCLVQIRPEEVFRNLKAAL